MSFHARFWRFVKRGKQRLICNEGGSGSLTENQRNSTGRATSRRLFTVLICLLPMSLLILLFSTANDQSAIKQIPHEGKGLCVNSRLAVDPPTADGLIQQRDVPASQWKPFNSTSRKGLTDRRIVFHETSGTNELKFRQCCSVESAAKNNPDRPVQLFLRPLFIPCHEHLSNHPSDLFHKPLWLEILSNYPNVEVILLNEEHYFAGTPLQDWYEAGKWRQTLHKTVHFADYIRFVTLHKGGGLYLDTDVLTLRPFQGDKFRNFLSYDGVAMEAISSGVMHLEAGHWLAPAMMRVLAKKYDPTEVEEFHGSEAVSSFMHKSCGMQEGDPKSNACKDIHLLPSRFFFPIKKLIAAKQLDKASVSIKGPAILTRLNMSYGVHTWNSMRNDPADLSDINPSIFGALAQMHCPMSVARASKFQN